MLTDQTRDGLYCETTEPTYHAAHPMPLAISAASQSCNANNTNGR
jgi:hypothetical protein